MTIKHLSHIVALSSLFAAMLVNAAFGQKVLRVGVAGLTHDHVHNIMHQFKNGQVIIAGIAESDPQLIARYKKTYQLPDSLFYNTLSDLLAHTHPDAVLAYNAISEHLGVVEICAPKGISVMVEKPLATTVRDADRIATLAKQFHIQVLTNYETTWYNTNQQIFEMVNGQHAIGDVRKMIVHDGHQGPKEIGCSPDFLNWLTDPVKNGGGAIRDFGCYGANLMTWLMHGQAPIAVTAVTHQIKPDLYPKVDDDATILLEYPTATGIIEASWNWPFGIKDWEVFGATGYLHALNDKVLHERMKQSYDSIPVHPATYRDNISYLADVLSGKIDPAADLSSLPNNLIVVRILEAASRSAREGKRITL
ncbi:MAG TPA: Gfo/Idh/MocA family oxidoreductase [Puia sp.]|jgi:predicted dehydrogenase|nr:Gfo/Idh/MocA family oxidoreductase [Puia sp.]